MNYFPARLSLVIVSFLLLFTSAFAGPLDDYYLQQFGEATNSQLQKAVLSVSTDVPEAATCGMPLKKSLRRDWDLLEAATQKVLAKQLARPAYDSMVTSTGGHFRVYYFVSGTEAPDIAKINLYTGLHLTSATDWANTVAATFEFVFGKYGSFGYRLAPTSTGEYDIYLHNLASQGYYGVTNSDLPVSSTNYPYAYTSWMELDNDFTESIYKPAIYSPLQSLQITAAHEYHHAVQYGYNYYFDIWYAEATSTWMEDELYDDVNQSYSYITNWFTQSKLALDTPVSTTTGGGYGRWIFNRFLAETRGPAAVRGAWEKLASLPSPGGNADIPMVPVLESLLSSSYGTTLGNDFFGFAKRVYQRNWSSHIDDIGLVHTYSPLASYSVSALPINAYTLPVPKVTLPHYSFAYYRFVPTAGAPSSLPISLTGTSGIMATAFRKSGSTITEFPFTSFTVSVPGFNTSTEVVLLVANTTDIDNHQANFSTDGTGLPVSEPTGGTVYPPLQPATPTTSSSSSSGGCFIATAAYGSYLHPQVQLLRDFRNNYLLTNAPGRAFVALYYRFSPPLADVIDRHPVLRSMVRMALTPLVMAVAHPLIAAVSLLLLIGTMLVKATRSNAHPYIVHDTPSRL